MTRTYQRFKASGQQFEIESKYDFIRPIGHGAYGVVISALDKEKNNKVAIKKITRVFDDPVDAKRILREIKLMKKFNHENVIRIIDLCPPSPETTEFDDIYIVQDLMETDLHRIIYSRQELSLEHVQYFIYQILRGLKYIHSANVIHRDLKPSNILVNGNCDLKICDFGLARGIEDEQVGSLTEYVVTRWYRAPEIMLACHEYTKAIDIWSVGCIFAELLGRQALFPGNDYIAQLRLICEKLGRPTEKEMDFITSDRAKRFIISLPDNLPVPMAELFPEYKNESSATDLFQKMMIFHPSNRITIDEALKHSFMSSLHNSDDEPVANFTFQFSFENEVLSKEKVQELIWDEIHELHPDIPTTFPTSTNLPSKKRIRSNSADYSDTNNNTTNNNNSNNNTPLQTSNLSKSINGTHNDNINNGNNDNNNNNNSNNTNGINDNKLNTANTTTNNTNNINDDNNNSPFHSSLNENAAQRQRVE